MTFLITGGYGFIGSHFIRLLRREKPQWRIVNLDLLTYTGNIDNLADLNFAANDPTIASTKVTLQILPWSGRFLKPKA